MSFLFETSYVVRNDYVQNEERDGDDLPATNRSRKGRKNEVLAH